MIYAFGMSHIINVLKAASATTLSFTHENWSTLLSNGEFFDLSTRPGVVRDDLIKVFVASPGVGWGQVADFRDTADGQRQVVATEGYVQLLRTVESHQDGNTLLSFIHGNELSGISLIRHKRPYDFFLPGETSTEFLDDGVQPISYAVVQRQVAAAVSTTVACLAMARILLPRIRLVHFLPPPPIESVDHLMRNPEIFRDTVEKFGLMPLSTRVKYYTVFAQTLRDALLPFQVEVVDPPDDSRAANGALRSEYVYGATHANEAYGALVVQQIAALVT